MLYPCIESITSKIGLLTPVDAMSAATSKRTRGATTEKPMTRNDDSPPAGQDARTQSEAGTTPGVPPGESEPFTSPEYEPGKTLWYCS